jgi:hypothetical protein
MVLFATFPVIVQNVKIEVAVAPLLNSPARSGEIFELIVEFIISSVPEPATPALLLFWIVINDAAGSVPRLPLIVVFLITIEASFGPPAALRIALTRMEAELPVIELFVIVVTVGVSVEKVDERARTPPT